MPLQFDHLVVVAGDLDEGAGWVEDQLGQPLEVGGRHPHMGTWNRLMSLGPGAYLEVIAVDPSAEPPLGARWFGLDRMAGPPRLAHWVARTDDLAVALAAAPDGMGEVLELSRGDLAWRMAVPGDGELPYDGAAPALIQWAGDRHPSDQLPDCGCRLERLEIAHPEADALATEFAELLTVGRVGLVTAGRPGLTATIQTQRGRRRL